MGEYRRDNTRSRGFGGNHSGGRSSGGYGGNRGGDRGSRGGFGGRDRKPLELHDVVCDKCGKETQVPFKPTGDKPVFCRDCYDKQGGDSSSGRDRGPRGNFNRGSGSAPSGVSEAAFKELSAKVDKILKILENIEIEEEEAPLGESKEDKEEESEEAIEEEKESKDSE